MNFIVTGLLRRSSVALKSYLRDVIQTSKRAMLRLGVVPPPFRIQIDITDRCNFRCPTCSKWNSADPDKELGLQEWKVIFEKIRNVPLLQEVTITGGEPFARQDIFEILEFAKQQKLYTVVISNGWLVDGNVLKRLDEIEVDRLMVSLNSLKESIHDESRTAPGSFNRIMRLVEAWRDQPRITDLCLAAVIMEPNCRELSALASFVHEKGLNGIIFQVLAPEEAHYPFSRESRMRESVPAWYASNPLWVRSVDILHREVDRLLRLQKEGCPIINPVWQLQTFPLYYEDPDAVRELPCLGTLSTMYIDPFGDIRLCYGYSPVGNILRDDPQLVWWGDQARKIRLKSRKCNRLCRLLNNNL